LGARRQRLWPALWQPVRFRREGVAGGLRVKSAIESRRRSMLGRLKAKLYELAQPATMRVVLVLLVIVALALAVGAPFNWGGLGPTSLGGPCFDAGLTSLGEPCF